ncbi:hypothetical protein SKAU_G00274220 [Synaphobranchus kaupii]|uniref:Uncharacterized protein n=1 Tax=Synaphobranchus kaupii TaxID=118154 RepID=A0A9Q1F0Z0_SYNKA|nr:hypothetical protein SKAU_G00274220 [Synaphobranchus kaupii]
MNKGTPPTDLKMDSPFWYLFLLSVCLCPVLTVSSQTPNAPTTQTETAGRAVSPITPAAYTTGRHFLTDTSTSVREEKTATTPVVSLFVTSQTTPPAHNESTATPATSVTDVKSSTPLPTTSIPGNTSRTETISSPPLGTSAHRFTSGTTTVPPVSAAATWLPTMPGTSSARPTGTAGSISPTPTTGNSLTTLAFGVMTFILILIVVMVGLVTAVNLRGRCNSSKEGGKKSGDSVVSESQVTSNGEKESITLVSVKTINTETDTDSPQISSIHSTTLDSEEQELRRDLLNTK